MYDGSVTVAEWARQEAVPPKPALHFFQEGRLPVPAHRVSPRPRRVGAPGRLTRAAGQAMTSTMVAVSAPETENACPRGDQTAHRAARPDDAGTGIVPEPAGVTGGRRKLDVPHVRSGRTVGEGA